MSKQQRDAIDAALRAEPFGLSQSTEEHRKSFEAFALRPYPSDVAAADVTLGGVGAIELTVAGHAADPTVLYFHGGGYRLAPEHPYPAAVEDRARRGDHVSMTDFLAGYVVPLGAGLTDDPGLKASQHSTGGALSVFETMVEAGPPLHVHDREDECFYVLDGELSIRCGGDAFDAPAGSFVFLPRGRPHRFWARDQPARLLLIVVPGGIEGYFGQINNAPDDGERHRIGELYGIRVVPD